MYFSCSFRAFIFSLIVCLVIFECHADANGNGSQIIPKLVIDAGSTGRHIPDTLFGVFYEEINHAGAGGLWAELVKNKGFEAGFRGLNDSQRIDPWTIIGDQNKSSITVSTDMSSSFERNKVALRMDILCQGKSCPRSGVGISNPGYWGMNIEQGKMYKVVLHVKSLGPIDLKVSFVGVNGVNLGAKSIRADGLNVTKWSKMERIIKAKGTNHNSSLQITTKTKGVIRLDQVSAMPSDTYNGHGFRSDLFKMVEGNSLKYAFRWKETVGPREERSGHWNDVYSYWSDDGLGYFEGLQLAEDLGALPIWVFNAGISRSDEISTANIGPWVQEALDGIEFARGHANSQWGSVRASMGHPQPCNLKFVAIGNEDCGMQYYEGNYMKFYEAIKRTYPDIQIISNCNGSEHPLKHPADIYEYHVYTSSPDMFSRNTRFDKAPRSGPKALFVSEYAVWRDDAGHGSLYAAVAEAAFLIGIERNSDLVIMASYAPLLMNINMNLTKTKEANATWTWWPDAIVFNSYQNYGTPSY
ncbi:putative glycosidase [Medicago truncatula]|uniref:non-reducing end alpha-L-arabinofuranosidase n=1 Tax=Medicago truncatula TaxID=3880 RepID=A0A396JBZ1_MEDTR|nr:putative glycosidase [Medicago truncatula]